MIKVKILEADGGSVSRPEVRSLWSFEDPGYVPGSGLITREGKPRESVYRMKKLEESLGFNFPKK